MMTTMRRWYFLRCGSTHHGAHLHGAQRSCDERADDERADDLSRKQYLYQLRLLRGPQDFFWYFYLEEGTLGACAWGFVGLGPVFGGLRVRFCASPIDGY